MPGIIVFRRRWSAGSDDLVVPAVFLLILHGVWLLTLSVIYEHVEFNPQQTCSVDLKNHLLGYIIILSVCILLETLIMGVSVRGGILDTQPRASMQYLLYARLGNFFQRTMWGQSVGKCSCKKGQFDTHPDCLTSSKCTLVLFGEIAWLIIGIKWLVDHYTVCGPDPARKAVLGIVVCNCCVMLSVVVSLWCTFDYAGAKWVKMKRYQESLKEKARRARRSGSARRNWRQRKAIRAYEESWDRRFRLLCCCVERKGRNKNSMTEIAQIFTEFFRDLDVVPSDVIAGLVLLRRYQKLRMVNTIQQETNDIYRYLSGIPITPRTEFLQLGQPEVLAQYKQVIHYMRFALAAYGWPVYMMMNTGTGLCRMLPHFSCCCCRCCCPQREQNNVIGDNCCECNAVALKKVSGLSDAELIYITYHVDIGETPFYVALDNKYKKIVVSVRGTLSLQDVLTDLKADAETIPTQPLKEDWVGHKGMVQAAIYIRKKLKEDQLLEKAFEKAKSLSSEQYDIVLVGHSLGAGTAAILAILLQQEYPGLHCYAYSPPGGLLSLNCVEETRHFITSVVVGKDVVPRIGLPQMELLRTDLINVIKKSKNPKWKIILKALCCGSESAAHFTYDEVKDDMARNVTAHPSDEQIGLSAHKPLYPPGKIILVVRNHSGEKGSCCQSSEPVYQAIWADNSDFQEVLISPTMVNDHMPDNVMEGLEKVLVNVAPPKPMRLLSEMERKALLVHDISPSSSGMPEYPEKTIPNSNFPVNNFKLETVPSISWDILAIDDKFITLERLESDKQHLYPAYKIQPHLELDLITSDGVQAPLASPETLSEVSSLGNSSRNNSFKDSIQETTQTVTIKLETIHQSPELHAKLKQEESGDVSNNSNSAGEVSVDVPDKSDVTNKSQLFDDTIISCANQVKNSAIQQKASPDWVGVNNRDRGSVPSESSSSVIIFPPPGAVIEEDKSYSYDTYDRHSPDHCTQYGYGNPNEHYSAAGIGYPHGFGAYHPPIKHQYANSIAHSKSESPFPHKPLSYSQSDSHLQTLSHKYQMKRSTEQRDIAHLQDSVYVFETGALPTIKTLPQIDDTTNEKEEEEEEEENNRSNMPQSSSVSSHADSSDFRLSSQSDEIMEYPVEETDV